MRIEIKKYIFTNKREIVIMANPPVSVNLNFLPVWIERLLGEVVSSWGH